MGHAAAGGAGSGDQRLDLAQQILRIERLLEVAVSPHRRRFRFVELLERADQQQHRDLRMSFLGLTADLVAVGTGHVNVGDHQMGTERWQLLESRGAVTGGGHLVVLVHEGQLHHLLDRHAIVGE